jgi:serine/threonine protein kinase
MEFCQGGSLIDIMKKNKHFSEQSVAHIMKQLLSALAYLHSMNIVHRDIKLDNIVALSEDSDGFISIKIIDFGTATKVSAFRTKGKICGTRSYMAPEVFQGKVNVKSDVWSSGVFLYLLFMGKFPFMANSLL